MDDELMKDCKLNNLNKDTTYPYKSKVRLPTSEWRTF